jgi:hypothetical protein
MPREFTAPENCPVCGADVPRGAAACPGCGADERTGWNEEATRHDDLDLPAEAFDEKSETDARRQHARGLWLVVAAGLLVLLIITFIFR